MSSRENNAVVIPTEWADDEPRIIRTSWRVACRRCGRLCYLSSGSARYAAGYQPLCVPCFEDDIGPDRARFIMRKVMVEYFNAHEGGQCVPGLCPVIGCPRGPAEIN